MKSHAAANTSVKPSRRSPDSRTILVGVEYFNGWWKKSPNKWETGGKDWRVRYPDRIPLLGEYNSQETMDKEIETAAAYGADFFSILWYYPGNLKAGHGEECPLLNAGLEHFLQSPNAHRMKFMVELCNHAPFAIISDTDWDHCMDVCIRAMRHPSYLRIDGRAALKIHSGPQFHEDHSRDVERSIQVLQRLRRRAADAGVGELLITVGTYSGHEAIDADHPFAKIRGIDATMQYMFVPEMAGQETDYPYEDLLNSARQLRELHRHDRLNWVPYFPAGWNPRPWAVPQPCYRLPSREQWKQGLSELKADLLATPAFGFPMRNGETQKAFTIYAWNEFGEGGMVAPTRGDQYMKLEVLREVFGNRSARGQES